MVGPLIHHDVKPGKIAADALNCALGEAFIIGIVDPQDEGSTMLAPQEIISHSNHRTTLVQVARGRRCVADANSHDRRMAVIGG